MKYQLSRVDPAGPTAGPGLLALMALWEIAALTGIAINSIGLTISRALAKLRQILQG